MIGCLPNLTCLLIGLALALAPLGTAAETIRLTKKLTSGEAGCLSELLSIHYRYPGDHTDSILELRGSARVGRTILSKKKYKAYLFLFENTGWCGSAGCMLIIGERRKDGRCHMLYDGGDGSRNAIRVLRRRDYGYRRLYTPCEVRFDGRQYQQMRVECPNAVIHR